MGSPGSTARSPSDEGSLVMRWGVLALAAVLVASTTFAWDAATCVPKRCTGCTQPHPADPCLGSLPPSGDCLCYNDFTIQFAQTVRVSATNLNTACGGGRSGWFIIRRTDWTEAYAWDMGSPAFAWSSEQAIAAGTYRLEPSAQWGGDYCVEYWSGPPDCGATLTMASPNFGEVTSGTCSPWRNVTFTYTGNMGATGTSVTSGDPAFALDLTGMPSSLTPGGSFTVKVRFCPLAGLTSDTPYSAFLTASYTCNSAGNSRQVAVQGIGHVPRGELDVASTFDVGQADWTLPSPGDRVDRSLRIDNSGDAPMTASATITDSVSGVFSLPSGGSVGSISGGSHKNLTIRATVSAETTYTGQLRVDADYGGGLNATRTVTLTARGHHPVPHLTLQTPDIDYHEVEQGYAFHQAVNVENTGDAALSFDIRLQDAADPDIAEFALDLGHKSIGVSGSDLYEVTFHPAGTGAKELFLVLDGTNEEPPTTHTVRLHGSGTAPLPLSTMLVVDRSGSMSGAAGAAVKIQATRDAGLLYAELVRDAWDWVGVTRFNQASSTLVNLGAISANRAAIQATLNDIGGQLLPDGSTCIGCGMQTASADFALGPAANSQAMIVLTDGKENVHPYIAEVKAGIQSANPTLKIFCVGIGTPVETGPYGIDGIETSKLQAIADDTDGLFQVIQSLSGESRYALEAFYFKAFAKATGRQLALDPLYNVAFGPAVVHVASFDIVTCDRDADVLLISDALKIPALDAAVAFKDPTGQVILAGSTVGGVAVQVRAWDRYRLYRLKFPPRSDSSSYVGTWELILLPVGGSAAGRLDKLSSQGGPPGSVPLALMAAVGSDYRLQAEVTPGTVLVGQPLPLTARTTEAWWPNPATAVTARVKRPDGSIVTHSLFDDGAHGDGAATDATFALAFTDTWQKGYYELLFRSEGTTSRGEHVVREVLRAKYIGPPLPDEPEGRPCLPCWVVQWFVVLTLLLLLLILAWLIRCCRRVTTATRK